MVKEKTKAGLKWKKKQWYAIKAPARFEGRVIGETLAEKPEQLIGRTFAVNSIQLNTNLKKKGKKKNFFNKWGVGPPRG